VPTEANLLEEYGSFAELRAAGDAFCKEVNAREHRETRRPPVDQLAYERRRLHPVPDEPYTVAFGVRSELVVVDDVGLLPADADAAEALYRLVDAAYEKRSLILDRQPPDADSGRNGRSRVGSVQGATDGPEPLIR
jgi:hypothetical protein